LVGLVARRIDRQEPSPTADADLARLVARLQALLAELRWTPGSREEVPDDRYGSVTELVAGVGAASLRHGPGPDGS
jgi:hypothetical protein